MAQLVAYLRFDGNCREAMTFYQECLGGKLQIMTVGESQMAEKMPPELHSAVMHSYLASGQIKLMATDLGSSEPYKLGNHISLCLVCDSPEEIKDLFAKLSVDGKVVNALREEFFGTYGDLVDKFGMAWMFQYSPEKL